MESPKIRTFGKFFSVLDKATEGNKQLVKPSTLRFKNFFLFISIIFLMRHHTAGFEASAMQFIFDKTQLKVRTVFLI